MSRIKNKPTVDHIGFQDNVREQELSNLLQLIWNPQNKRDGDDAVLEGVDIGCEKVDFLVELKSTSKETVSTARDLGQDYIDRMRKMMFVVGYYEEVNGLAKLHRTLCLTPLDLEPWFCVQELQVSMDAKLAKRAAQNMSIGDLYFLLGKKSLYTLSDAKNMMKNQLTAQEYSKLGVYSKEHGSLITAPQMLDLLISRVEYIGKRGSTKNNPHIPKGLLQNFFGTDREVVGDQWAQTIRSVAKKFASDNPQHPAILKKWSDGIDYIN